MWWIFGIDGCGWIEVELLGKYVDLYNKCLTLELHMLINVDTYTCYMQIHIFSPQPRCFVLLRLNVFPHLDFPQVLHPLES